MDDILAYFRSRIDVFVARLDEFVRLETPTGDAARMAVFVNRLAQAIELDSELMCTVCPTDAGPHLFATSNGERPPIVFVGHADTVWPAGTCQQRPPALRARRLWGPGALDMKAGLCLALEVLGYLARSGGTRRALQLFVSADEEQGSPSAHPIMDKHLHAPAIALVLEPPCEDGGLKMKRHGVARYRIQCTGAAAHAGSRRRGDPDAIVELARIVATVDSWNNRAPDLSFTVGRMGGGTQANIIADSAWCEVDVRLAVAQAVPTMEHLFASLRAAHAELNVEVRGGSLFPPLLPNPASDELYHRAVRCAARFGLEQPYGSSGGGSDGSYLASRGFVVLDGLGVPGRGPHALDEQVYVDRFPLRAASLAALVLDLDDPAEDWAFDLPGGA
jgi:glutamate carboxypeptidase